MAVLIKGLADALVTARDLCLQTFQIDISEKIPLEIRARLVVDTPFLLTSDAKPLSMASKFLRLRAQGEINLISETALKPSTSHDYGRDLKYFLTTFNDPLPDLILLNHRNILRKYREELNKNGDSNSTNDRRYFIARQFIEYLKSVSGLLIEPGLKVEQRFRTSAPNLSGKRINVEIDESHFGRRRHPSIIFMLSPKQIIAFFSAFRDRTLRVAAKLIFSTGARRAPVEFITAGQIAALDSKAIGRPQKVKIIGKANNDYDLELEQDAIAMLQLYLTSKERMDRVGKFVKKHAIKLQLPYKKYDDDIPLFINRFGDPLTGPAIEEAFRRVSDWSNIRRTPHEMRHEYAMQYLVNKYRSIAKRISAGGFRDWIARLMLESADLIVVELSRRLGHRDPEFTKRTYLTMLRATDDGLRSEWCDFLGDFLKE